MKQRKKTTKSQKPEVTEIVNNLLVEQPIQETIPDLDDINLEANKQVILVSDDIRVQMLQDLVTKLEQELVAKSLKINQLQSSIALLRNRVNEISNTTLSIDNYNNVLQLIKERQENIDCVKNDTPKPIGRLVKLFGFKRK